MSAPKSCVAQCLSPDQSSIIKLYKTKHKIMIYFCVFSDTAAGSGQGMCVRSSGKRQGDGDRSGLVFQVRRLWDSGVARGPGEARAPDTCPGVSRARAFPGRLRPVLSTPRTWLSGGCHDTWDACVPGPIGGRREPFRTNANLRADMSPRSLARTPGRCCVISSLGILTPSERLWASVTRVRGVLPRRASRESKPSLLLSRSLSRLALSVSVSVSLLSCAHSALPRGQSP